MTSLARDLASHFDTSVRKRGVDYYRGGRVQIEDGSESRIAAIVRGSDRYEVHLERDHDEIRATCTCPHFDTDMCKHIWACILAADAQQLLRGDGRGGRVLLAYDDLALGDAEPGENSVDAAQYRAVTPAWHAGATRGLGSRAKPPSWRAQLERVRHAEPSDFAHADWPAGRELLYVIDARATLAGHGLYLELWSHDPKKDGTRTKPKLRSIPRQALNRLPDSDDRYVLAFLAGANEIYGAYTPYYGGLDDYASYPARYRLADPQPELIVPALCRTGRCRLKLRAEDAAKDWLPLAWDDGDPWRLRLSVTEEPRGAGYRLSGTLCRGEQKMPLTAPAVLTSGGIVITHDRVARYEIGGAFAWVSLLREQGSLAIPAAEREALVAELFEQPALPPLNLPAELEYDEVRHEPRPRLTVKPAPYYRQGWVLGEVEFDYAGSIVASEPATRGLVQAAERRVLLRDLVFERAAVERLLALGWRPASEPYPPARRRASFELASARLSNTVRELTRAGWYVEAEGKIFRSAGRFDVEVTSGIDWFELHGKLDFGDGASALLPELLAAVRRGENRVALADGSFGLIPEEWLERYGLLTGLGTAHEDHVRFRRAQVGLLDALLAARPETSCDAQFEHARRELLRFSGIEPAEPPPGFHGTLRPYQKEGLGWLAFLRRFRFGGCLADDMGLGKTVQVLALLEAERAAHAHDGIRRPSLVVVPRSLIFNWQREAARFVPELSVLDYTGAARRRGERSLASYDAVLTTYGTLRSDIADLKDVAFNYVILDEAQAIKNAASVSAKAVRLLKSEHRLALSGTPIENRLSELWSLFEFLNPGMLGSASAFKSLSTTAPAQNAAGRQWLAHALRPFLLRRTKEQVLRDLPAKVEQTLYCEMEPKQRKLYEELRDHYRSALLKRIELNGIKRAKIQILEALLRLRQAAIHPGLLDEKRHGEPSAKLDLLLPRLEELRDEGHKTLVFSQFTAMLAIVRRHLDAAGVAYEYLDGQTKNREERVARFQNDADCRLFMVSLKAGGLGLNLTAAQYVFLLDPWWNPAVEAQAIDRAHRIGQAQPVHAYRLIARDTIEEKILELQQAKRGLADAIIGADNAVLRTLSKEDLELLLA